MHRVTLEADERFKFHIYDIRARFPAGSSEGA